MDAPRTQELTDQELDTYILTRLKSLGVDLGVLPEDDPEAPADRKRILTGARRFLRTTPQAIMAWEPDPQGVAPSMYPASLGPVLRERGDG